MHEIHLPVPERLRDMKSRRLAGNLHTDSISYMALMHSSKAQRQGLKIHSILIEHGHAMSCSCPKCLCLCQKRQALAMSCRAASLSSAEALKSQLDVTSFI